MRYWQQIGQLNTLSFRAFPMFSHHTECGARLWHLDDLHVISQSSLCAILTE